MVRRPLDKRTLFLKRTLGYQLSSKLPQLSATDALAAMRSVHDVMSNGVGLPEDGTHYTVGPWLTFDPQTERHTGEFATEANELLKDANRPGFQVPDARKV